MKPFLIAQISDPHVRPRGRLCYGRVDTAAHLARAVAEILALPQHPDILVATGDLVDAGRDEDYALLRELLEPLRIRTLLIPGNHDDRDALRRVFADHPWLAGAAGDTAGPREIRYAIEDMPVRIVALDTVIPGEPGGRLSEESLDWLDRTLSARGDAPTVVIMHHPPFATFIGHMDAMGLDNPAALAAVISRHPQVQAVLCGHLHRSIQTRFAGTIAMTCPSTAHQVALDFASDAPDRYIMEPPGFMLHAWSAAAGLVSHVVPIGDFAGPYSFGD